MSARTERLAACGLYCGACYHFRARFPEGQHLLEEAERRGRDRAHYTCQGCRSDVLYIHPGCAECKIRACADAKGLPHCGLCPDFPCEQIEAFENDGRVHHLGTLNRLRDLKAKGAEVWLSEQMQRWTCTCGAPFSWYELVCRKCGAPLNSYGPDPTLK